MSVLGLDSDLDGIADTFATTRTFISYMPSDKPVYSLVIVSPNIEYKIDEEGKTMFWEQNIVERKRAKRRKVDKKLSLPNGVTDYRKISSEYYYVDKTLLIRDFYR